MKRFILFTVMYLVSATLSAATEVQLSRSVGKLLADDSVVLAAKIKTEEFVAIAVTDADARDQDIGLRQSLVANRHDQYFLIYQADVHLLSDLDRDGFHHALNVSFDIDVNFDGATVYAKLFLSRNGGPWRQYYTTDLFSIYADDADDEYEVSTELVEGYAPGYYDVLIEVYSLNHTDMVTSKLVDEYYLGRPILLEDLDHDESWYLDQVSYSHGGSGSFSLVGLLLIFLLSQAIILARNTPLLATKKTK